LDGQKLAPGFMTPAGSGTALETVMDLMSKMDPVYLPSNPIPFPAPLFTPAWVSSLAVGRDAIYLEDVDGNLKLPPGPAYIFASS
jgi:hypothetical protein